MHLANYPAILSELETIELAHAGMNLARYGDGEYNHCFGKKNVSQPADPKLTRELCAILKDPPTGVLRCIPNAFAKGTKPSWARDYATPAICNLLGKGEFGSSFVTRSDSAPWIDTPEYWARIEDFWRGKDIALVAGTMRSLRPEMLTSAASVKMVSAPSGQKGDGAYAAIDRLEDEMKAFPGPVLICLGPTATVLAARLARHGVHAQDLGHIGMYLRSAGAYRYQLDDLISPLYRQLLQEQHASGKWGNDGAKHVDATLAFRDELQAASVLDYGSGGETLRIALDGVQRVMCFDPGVKGREGMPKPADLTICCDVLEHVERDKLDNVMRHLKSITLKGAYIVIATRPAKAILPDGRNAHLIVQDAAWWCRGLETAGFKINRFEDREGKEVRIWAVRQ